MFLSYASADEEGKALRPSILINRIKKIFTNLEEESDVVTKKYDIINEDITFKELLENIYKLRNKEQIDELWYDVYEWYRNNPKWAKILEENMEGLKYTNIPKKIKKKT